MAWTFTIKPSDLLQVTDAKLGTDTVANSGHLTSADVGKPVKLLAAGRYGLCSDGDNIDGWLVAVNDETQDGYAFGTVQTGGRIYAQLSGGSTFGYVVEAASPAAARTAESSGYGQVSSSAIYTTLDATATADEHIPFILAKKWKIISGAVTDDAIVLLEKQ